MRDAIQRLGGVLGVAVALALVSTTAIPAAQESTDFSAAHAKLPGELLTVFGPRRAWTSDVMLQRVEPAFGGRLVQRHRCERADPSSPFQCESADETTSYLVTALTTRLGGDDVFVAGLKADGTAVVERWSSHLREGGWTVTVTSPSQTTIGSASPTFVQQPQAVLATSWQPVPTGGRVLPALDRSELFTTPMGPITALAADPEGRFLLFYDLGVKAIYRLELTAQAALTVVASVIDVPTLDRVGSMELHDFEGEGRKCLVRRCYLSDGSAAEESYLILADANNDGAFESKTVFGQAQWNASSYGDWSKWRLFTKG